jgi:RimJ/RimL family protein N-acetyltransferase
LSRYRIFPADPVRNREDILGVLGRNLPNVSLARLVWNSEFCPHGGARWWLAEAEESRTCVGVCGLFPRRIRVAGRTCRAAVIGDFAVDQAHRAFGPALALQKAVLAAVPAAGLDFIYTKPNEQSEALILKLGYHPVGEMARYAKVLRTEYRQGAWLPPRLLTRAGAAPLNAALAFFSRERRRRRPAGWTIAAPEHFDASFDRFWKRVADQWPILGERTAEDLQWRFRRSPFSEYRCFALLGPDQEILGYIIYYILDNVCRIADLLELNERGVGEILLAEFILHLRKLQAGSVMVRYLGHTAMVRRLSDFGFLRLAKRQARLMVYTNPAGPRLPEIHDTNAWNFFEGDNDTLPRFF